MRLGYSIADLWNGLRKKNNTAQLPVAQRCYQSGIANFYKQYDSKAISGNSHIHQKAFYRIYSLLNDWVPAGSGTFWPAGLLQ